MTTMLMDPEVVENSKRALQNEIKFKHAIGNHLADDTIYKLWSDGEITHQKGPRLHGNSIQCLQRPVFKSSFLQLPKPVPSQSHSYAVLSRAECEEYRDRMKLLGGLAWLKDPPSLVDERDHLGTPISLEALREMDYGKDKRNHSNYSDCSCCNSQSH
jgi:hypothetical protein